MQIPIWYNYGKSLATGKGSSGTLGGVGLVGSLMASKAGPLTRSGNYIGAMESSNEESEDEAWDAFREVIERGGSIE